MRNRKTKKISAKQVKIDAAKASAPNVPGDTCPSINYVQEIIEQIANRGDDWAGKQGDVITELLEYVRDSNQELRTSSKYWYDRYKENV
jgi:hypothetical protein|tara:strand:+ start:476 stop:742 length:267 start_codon:yes stop_codon:yes gene_type:complete